MRGEHWILFILSLVGLLTVSHKVFIGKLMKYRLDARKVRWIENCQNCWAQRVMIRLMKPIWKPVTSCVS